MIISGSQKEKKKKQIENKKKKIPNSKDEIGNINDSGKHAIAHNIFENVAKGPMIREYLHLHQ